MGLEMMLDGPFDDPDVRRQPVGHTIQALWVQQEAGVGTIRSIEDIDQIITGGDTVGMSIKARKESGVLRWPG